MDYEDIKETIVYSAVAWLVFISMEILYAVVGFAAGVFTLGVVEACTCNT